MPRPSIASTARTLLVALAILALTATAGAPPAGAAPAAPVITGPVNGTVLGTASPPISGTAEPGTEVRLEIDGVLAGGPVTTDAAGHWTITPLSPLAEGARTARAWAGDIADPSPLSAPVTFTVDITAPPAPVVTSPAAGATSAGRPTYGGTAEPHSTVEIQVDGAPVGTTPVDAAGSWALTQPVGLPHGAHAVWATARDAAGNISPRSITVGFTVDLIEPDAPVILSPTNGSTTTSRAPAYAGTAEPGSTVTVRVDGAIVATTTADGAGVWSLTQPLPLADGAHMVSAFATDRAGNVGASSAEHRFTVTTPTTPPPPGPADEDRDDDGLTDEREATLGTDPADADTDDDRLTDGQEVTGTRIEDRFKACGRPLRRSLLVTSDPLRADTDRDRIPDGTEVRGYRIGQRVSLRAGSLVIGMTRSDPRARDTDRDGLADGVERSGSANKAWRQRKTDPTRCDTDRGGASDGLETGVGSDPTRAANGPRDVR